MTEFEKQIYNTFLSTTKRIKNKPYKKREDFTGFENDVKYLSIKRLCILFSKHKDIDINLYFEAPYKIYNDATYFDLAYYASPRAIKAYTLYKKQIESSNPDEFIEEVKQSLLFLTDYCCTNNILLDDYVKQGSGVVPLWVEHVKSNKIHPYSLMELSGVYKTLNTLNEEEQTLLLGNFGTDYLNYRDRYNNSIKLKKFLQEATHKLQNLIFKRLQHKRNTIL